MDESNVLQISVPGCTFIRSCMLIPSLLSASIISHLVGIDPIILHGLSSDQHQQSLYQI